MEGKKGKKSYTIEFKLGVVKWYNENGENNYATERQFGIDRNRIHDWVENVDFLRQQSIVANGKKTKFTVRMPPMSEELDQSILNWLQEERAAGRVVFNKKTFRKRPYKLLHC